jgi:hypothetical protein
MLSNLHRCAAIAAVITTLALVTACEGDSESPARLAVVHGGEFVRVPSDASVLCEIDLRRSIDPTPTRVCVKPGEPIALQYDVNTRRITRKIPSWLLQAIVWTVDATDETTILAATPEGDWVAFPERAKTACPKSADGPGDTHRV